MVPRIFLLTALLAATLIPLAPAGATFVHSVGRDYMIREWVDRDMDSVILAITPIMYEGNPAYRVVFRPRSDAPDSQPTQMLVRADDFRTMKPVPVHPQYPDR